MRFDEAAGQEIPGRGEVLDVVLIGGGIMSATVGAVLARLEPDWSMALYERLDVLAGESSHPWHNAGTGHAGLCEPNYMPDPADPTRAREINAQYALSERFWAALAADGVLDPDRFRTATPHLTVVFGTGDVAYLRARFETLRRYPEFATMEYTEDPAVLGTWAPLLTAGRPAGTPMAATRHPGGTDLDFGALTTELVRGMAAAGVAVRRGHEITGLRRDTDGLWTVSGRELGTGVRFTARARFVFVGAGGYALRLLQRARLPEVRGYGVLPVGARFLRTDDPAVTAAHTGKVYSPAGPSAPPMSLPHLDRRVVDGQVSLLFGPYATFSTRLLRHGRLTDLFTTVRPHNLVPLLAAALGDFGLIRYLVVQLLTSPRRRFAQLRRFVPTARPADWYFVPAGQRAQLVRPHPRRGGQIVFGTELVTGADGTIAGLLGASPGASVAPAIVEELLTRCFPRHRRAWAPTLDRLLPAQEPRCP
ncbi:malate:quinone oxidoreductase [Nocardia thailandica]